MLRLSRDWMPASHLLAEEVSDFSRAHLKRELLTEVL